MSEGFEGKTLFQRGEQGFYGGEGSVDRVHPHGGGATYRRELPFSGSLPEAHGAVENFAFDRFQLSAVRRFVAAAATEAGVDSTRRSDVILAASELAANSILHGGGTGEARVWSEPGAFLCEVADGGVISDAMIGRRRPSPDQLDGRGLWIVNEVSDQMLIHSDEDGSVVRFRIDLF
jgi:anti-sigma regulatory factor (Ser/Thr protein kinase)